jgi:hypothetical protein
MEFKNVIHGDYSVSGFNESDECDLSDELEGAAGTQAIGITAAVTAADMGRKGGSSRSLDKRLAAQVNGKLGGRPKKTADALPSQDVPSAADVFINKKLWSTYSPEGMAQYKEDVFAYYRQEGFPYYRLTTEAQEDEYKKLKVFDYTKVIDGDVVRQTMHGLALAWNYHPHSWSVRCGAMLTPTEVFRDDDLLRRAIEKRITYGDNISDSAMRKALRSFSGTQSVSNFRPTAAASIFHHLLPEEGGTVYDPSAGFGGRLLGAMICDRVHRYIGTDPSTASMYGCQQMAHELNYRKIPIQLVNSGSENFRPDPESIDLALTSPPYFSTEHYSDEPTQSFSKFSSREEWMNDFMRRTLENCHVGLKPTGLLAINIANVKSYPRLEDNFVALATQTGFRLVRTMRLALSKMMGTRKRGENFKYEPIYVFQKEI